MTQPPFVVWIDPGLISGMATCDLQSEYFQSWQYEEDDLMRRLHELHGIHGDRLQLGWEDYLVTGGPQSGTPKHSLKVIGRLTDFVFVHGVTVLPAVPSSARKLGSVIFLRRLGWYRPGKVHANDASQHLLAYLLRMRPMAEVVRGKLFPGYATMLPSPPE